MVAEVVMSPRPGQVVCFETFRRERERRTAKVLPYLAPSDADPNARRRWGQVPFRSPALSKAEVDHRQQMLNHLSQS